MISRTVKAGDHRAYLYLPPTQDWETYATAQVTLPQAQDLSLTLSFDDADRQASGKALKIDSLTLRCGRWSALVEAETGAIAGSAAVADDANASGQKVVWLNAPEDCLNFPAPVLPCPSQSFTTEDYGYGWDHLNRLKSVTRQAGGLVASASFNYGAFGWQLLGSDVTEGETGRTESRCYGYGLGGELLKEWISAPGVGTDSRVYANDGVDRPLWSRDVAGANVTSSFWLSPSLSRTSWPALAPGPWRCGRRGSSAIRRGNRRPAPRSPVRCRPPAGSLRGARPTGRS